MRTFLLSIIISFSMCAVSVANTNDHSYLRIEIPQKTISYPPGTPFLAKDTQGNTVLSLYDLKQVGTFEITIPITLFVYVSWSDSPDVYQLKSGTLSLQKAKTYKKQLDQTQKTTSKKSHENVYLIKKQYFSYDEATGYDVNLEFSNGISFLYRDGKAKAWKNGEALTIKKKYIIETDEGDLKLSYNPKTQKIWWIFDKK
ncbi:MAG: hypothetical protein AAF611_22450 [Bacteroidota bacterium]